MKLHHSNDAIFKHQIFISSQMERGTLDDERHAARDVILQFDHVFVPWDWENDGPAGPLTPIEYCLRAVRQSYALVLIVSRTLTKHTHQEYNVARKEGKHLFVFFKKGLQRGEAFLFRRSLTKPRSPSWLVFENASELESKLYLSLQKHVHIALSEYRATPSTKPSYKGIKS